MRYRVLIGIETFYEDRTFTDLEKYLSDYQPSQIFDSLEEAMQYAGKYLKNAEENIELFKIMEFLNTEYKKYVYIKEVEHTYE
jgi:hypothetical protein